MKMTVFRAVNVRVAGVNVVVNLKEIDLEGRPGWRAEIFDGHAQPVCYAEHRNLEQSIRLCVAEGSWGLDKLLDRIRHNTRFRGVLTQTDYERIERQVADENRAADLKALIESDDFFRDE